MKTPREPDGMRLYVLSRIAIALGYVGAVVLFAVACSGCSTPPALKPGDPPVYVPTGPVSYPRAR